jgi:hypothetical protein
MKLSQQDSSSRSTAKYDIIAMERDEALAELAILKQKLEVLYTYTLTLIGN